MPLTIVNILTTFVSLRDFVYFSGSHSRVAKAFQGIAPFKSAICSDEKNNYYEVCFLTVFEK